ncbi:MAG: hypothetical protein ACI8ZF_000174 [Candidatus Midichloriaceae bacterium]|jgi:hypothetical protein
MTTILSTALINQEIRENVSSGLKSQQETYTKITTSQKYQHNYEKNFYEQKSSLETGRVLSDSAQKTSMLKEAVHKTNDMHNILTEVIDFIGKETKNWMQLSSPINNNNENFQKKAAKSILSGLQTAFNKKSSLDGTYLLAGEKIDTAPVDFSGDFDKDSYYKGSKTNIQFNVGENTFDFDFNAGNAKIADFVVVMKEIVAGTYTGDNEDIQSSFEEFFGEMNECRRLIDIQNSNYRDMNSAEEKRYTNAADTYNEITNIDPNIALIEMHTKNSQLQALYIATKKMMESPILNILR